MSEMRERRHAWHGPRFSIAGLMALVAGVAFDCAIFASDIGPRYRWPQMVAFLLVGVVLLTNVIGVGMVFPGPRR